MTPIDEAVARIMKACPHGLRLTRWSYLEGSVWLHVLTRSPDVYRKKSTRRLYDAFPPGYTFTIHFELSGGGGANQPFTTGTDPFPTAYNGKKVVSYHQDILVAGPPELLETLTNLNQLTQ